MAYEDARVLVNRIVGFPLAFRRGLRTVVNQVYTDIAAVESAAGTTDVALTTAAGAGITGGTGTVYTSSVRTSSGDIPIITTRIFIDLTGLDTSTTDLDVIGQGASAAHLGRITTAQNGIIFAGTMSCIETPATGADDIDLYSATVGTAVFDDGIAALTETALVTSGAAWTAGVTKALTGAVPADGYLYLTNGEAGTVGTFTAGKFIIELLGTSL